MTKTKFVTEFVVCRESHFSTLLDGREYVCKVGERYRADAEEVQRMPQFFVSDGERVIPFEPPPIEEPPPPKPKPKPKMLRTLKNWEATRTLKTLPGLAPETIHITLHADHTIREDTPWLVALTDRERRELFEVVP